ncbi:hypothetical protein AM500_12110 [Bacillus sp. FJAT-18017]|uniref:DUF4153 domain-containing protein n=1 Tax=Bacillus sp. FJAT-18017 TaxID=1705566 RepID=UPI0006AE77C2|nr:DUF4173 domain-containing protein [Bacillus sp. FJAT-18017]ALC90447.1 hypothetical protein AM500_12110 [Bacillus sp. FJAT-18017]
MQLRMRKEDWLFLLLCLGLGILAEEAFLWSQLGISHFIFIAAFYSLFFWRFRGFPFRNQRLGWLVLGAIWILSASYFLYDIDVFYALNLLAIPALVVFHISLITGPKQADWAKPAFLIHIIKRMFDSIAYNLGFTRLLARMAQRRTKGKNTAVATKVLIGIGISIPVLFVVLNLLISADSQFERIITTVPDWFSFDGEILFRIIAILIFTFSFFGFMQVHLKKRAEIKTILISNHTWGFDPVIILTVLLLLDAVYMLFVGVQFTYFFSGTLGEGYTYAEYARRGFFELVFVSLINLTATVTFLSFLKKREGGLWKAIQLGLSVLVLSSGVILASAFMRMMMYEEAYGFTILRVLVHSFMVFLLIIFAYTLLKVWLNRLSLIHFYFIAALVYYTVLNVIGIDRIVADRNLERYEQTGRIDVAYLGYMSDTGLLTLIDLYKIHPNVPGLKEELRNHFAEAETREEHWQAYNLTRERAREKLMELDLK